MYKCTSKPFIRLVLLSMSHWFLLQLKYSKCDKLEPSLKYGGDIELNWPWIVSLLRRMGFA